VIPTSSPNKAQTDWRELVRSQGCVLGYPGEVEIHHVAGRTASHCKIHIGHWLVLPVSNAAHREVERMSKADQKALFLDVCRRLVNRFESLPFDGDTMFAIMDWRR
jgi:hypothetical protein